MIQLVLPFIPPSANHTQKSTYSGRRYNTPKYVAFKRRVEEYILSMPADKRKSLSDLVKKPHSVEIVVFSKSVCTKSSKYNEMSLNFMDSDNPVKPTLDSIYPHLNANDARAVSSQGRKVWADIDTEYTVIQFVADTPFEAPQWAMDALFEVMN